MENINFLDAQAAHQLPQENGYPQRQQHPMQPQHPMESLGQTQTLPHSTAMPPLAHQSAPTGAPLVHTSVPQPSLTTQQQMYRVPNMQNTLPPNYNGAPNTLPGYQQPTPGRCLGLEYANMKKEKAREEYKENRKMQLLAMGEGSRIKRRKKNDTSMTENEKYHRRLKMNQDSAAAARHAQDVYVGTLEKLVETTEAEKSFLQYQNRSLLEEREGLFRTIQELRHQVTVANARAPRADGNLVDESSEQATAGDDPNAQSQVILKKMLELMGGIQDERPENAIQGAKKHVTEAA